MIYVSLGANVASRVGPPAETLRAAINAMAMLLEHSGYPTAGGRIDRAVAHVTGTKMKSQAAGKMGYGTKEVGDLVVAALAAG